ncbi:MAG: methionyl-tRNA formyltransferase [Alphaproteobacteria bacterium]
MVINIMGTSSMIDNKNPSKIIFMGSSPFASGVLSWLIDFIHHGTSATISAVYSQSPKPKHRGKKIKKTEVAMLAEQKNLLLRQPTYFDQNEIDFLTNLAPDLIIVVGYGLLLPNRLLSIPRWLALNIHPSLLPKYRGATPIESAILAGDNLTGVSLIKINDTLDGGDIIAMESLPLHQQDNRHILNQKLLALSITLLQKNLPKIFLGDYHLTPQQPTTASYSKKIKTSDYHIRPKSDKIDMVYKKILAYYPKCFLLLKTNQRLLLLEAKKLPASDAHHPPANHQTEIFFDQQQKKIFLTCQDGLLELISVKPENKNAMSATDWWRGKRN